MSGPLLRLNKLPITNIELTPELEQAIEAKQIKEQESLRKKYEVEIANQNVKIAEADARALKMKGDAVSASPRILDLEMKKLELEMTEKVLQKWNGQSPDTVVVGKGGGNILLPLR